MKGVSPSNSKGSPKTPGGISKSLLTPCRRVGLSRNWKKSGCSPFISPLSTQNTTPENNEEGETRKRKKCDNSEILIKTPIEQFDIDGSNVSVPKSRSNSQENNITTTPNRRQIPRKKSKTLSISLKNSDENLANKQISSNELTKESYSNESNDVIIEKTAILSDCRENKNKHIEEVLKPIKQTSEGLVSTPVRSESKGKNKLSLKKSNSKSSCNTEQKSNKTDTNPKEKSPNNLTKECIVVIQNKIFKTDDTSKIMSQESDADCDIPLSLLKRKSSNDSVTLNTLSDDDFIKKPTKEIQSKKKRNLSTIKQSRERQNSKDSADMPPSSQEDCKRTILIKKSYDKVTLPLKAKSTGSITQKDIDDIKARIEMKKKLLIAKAMGNETEELRVLIKKWQKGCQDALMELLELMKKKLPDQRNMDYAEMLQSLKIPSELVGYDSENDCFVTPDDVSVLLSTFKL